MGEFLDQLKQLLDSTDQITKKEVKEAVYLIRGKRWDLDLRREGPCLVCGETICYGKPCVTHIQRGDDWLDSLFNKWGEKPPTFSRRYRRDLTINGYKKKTVKPYICAQCQAKLNELISEFQAAERQEAAKEQRKTEDYETALIMGKAKGTSAKRFWTLRKNLSDENIKQLQQMPYQEFLGTIYWDIIRKYVLYKRGYACELCNADGKLNVHHKTYDHRGEEYDHLEDLIVLCEICHAKHHDKLADRNIGDNHD